MAKSREIIWDQLLERIDRTSAHTSISLIAAGGYGIVTLMSQHAAKTEREAKSYAWITLDEVIARYVVDEIMGAPPVRRY
jgi:hypothetical protein